MDCLRFALLFTLVGACDPKGADGDGGTEVPACAFTPALLGSVDDVALIGKSAAEVLAEVEGVYSGELSWIFNVGNHVNTGTSTGLSIELSYSDGEIRDVEAVVGPDGWMDGAFSCFNALEIDVNLRIVSDDGAVDETMVASLNTVPQQSYSGSPNPSIYHRLDLSVPGGLEAADLVLPQDTELRDVVLTSSFHRGAVSGSLFVELALGGEGGGIGAGPIAELGAVTQVNDASCGQLPGSACGGSGCASSSARSVYRMSETTCACYEEADVCTATPGTGPATSLWAWPVDADGEGYRVYALDNVFEPLGEPWVACADLPDEPNCSCFGGVNACP